MAFRSPEQFEPEAYRLASIAAEKVQEYRGLFSDLPGLLRVLGARMREHPRVQDAYHIAVAYGLLGRVQDAELSLRRAIIEAPQYGWHREWNEQVDGVRLALSDPERFPAYITGVVLEQRQALKLRPLDRIDLPTAT